MKVLVLNDTRSENHHGCSRVMNAIDFNLKQRGIRDVDYVEIGENWEQSEAIKRKIIFADLLLINGEGTIHHNAPYGLSLLRAGSFARKYGVKTALINCTFQANDAACHKDLASFDLISVRESLSLAEVEAAGVSARIVPDLSFAVGRNISAQRSDRVYVTDSVKKEVSMSLEQLTLKRGFSYSDITTGVAAPVPPKITRILSIWRNNTFAELMTKVIIALQRRQQVTGDATPKRETTYTHFDFSDQISTANLLICGRFHTMCYCMNNQTPFVAIDSNSHKMLGTLKDAGLDAKKRLLSLDMLPDLNPETYQYNDAEKEALVQYTQRAHVETQRLFDDLRGLLPS